MAQRQRAICGARTRAGTPCQQPAGWGTDHVGSGRCKLHGGASLRGADSPRFVHGRHSKFFSPSSIVGFDEWRAQLGPALDLADDLLAMIYVVREKLLRGEPIMVATRDGPMEWCPDPEYLTRCMARVAEVAETLWRQQSGQDVMVKVVIENEKALEMFDHMGRIVARHVKDPETRRLILEDFERLAAGEQVA